ncbi:MAG: DUF4914 family protein [Candidatus Omnitrophica bacterium]|nr:DUF4914 family protein [Candidatus Omnitrophota bacterium]
MANKVWRQWKISEEVNELLNNTARVVVAESRDHLFALASGGGKDLFAVEYPLPDGRTVQEAVVIKCKNGLAINYVDKEMRRRDPDCLIVGDEHATDKPRFRDVFKDDFANLRKETFDWLRMQDLLVAGITIGGAQTGLQGLIIAPANAGFFVGGLCDLQNFLAIIELDGRFAPDAILYLAPPFRHTHFNGKQIVVHNRRKNVHEVFSYNLYPGPSAKKGMYGVLLQKGEDEDWLTLHASTVQVVTPYENVTTFLHEGASGSGKSEMLEYPHREDDGRLLLGKNKITEKIFMVTINQTCALRPVTDDMALVDNEKSIKSQKLVVSDAENAWFLRVNHITHYGTDPFLERICVHPKDPLLFLNIQGSPRSTVLIWEHTEDSPGKACPNPRVILPRKLMPAVVDGQVEVDFRSFGIRAPFCCEKAPTYGIIGLFHVLSPALAWLWRLVSPRGHANPSILDAEVLSSEGVGSYWPFATGRYVTHANLLLKQMVNTAHTKYLLLPNQHVGSWEVGFMPQWVTREYFARRGIAKFSKDQLKPARCPLLGYVPARVVVEGVQIPDHFFAVERQSEVGIEAYDAGQEILYRFFEKNLHAYLVPEIDALGRKIISCCLDKGTAEDFNALIPLEL